MPGRAVLGRDEIRFTGVVIGIWALASLAACGDDDGPKGKPDGSISDAAVVDSGGGNFIPRRDASVAATDPIKDCDRFTPDSCPSGQVCDVLYRVFAGTDELGVYSGCVEPGRQRGLGDPCDSDFTTQTPYRTKDLTDIVFRDPCGPGLICAPDPDVRGGTSCQKACVSGNFGEAAPQLCEDSKSFCIGPQPFQEYCRPSDGCDIEAQTGCAKGESCYLRPTDDGKGFLTLCFPPAQPAVADGAACDAYNACRPGSSCNGPIGRALSTWVGEDFICRPACAADGSTYGGTQSGGSDTDGGDDDAGTSPTSGCGAKKCRPFSGTGLNLSGIDKPPFGQCE